MLLAYAALNQCLVGYDAKTGQVLRSHLVCVSVDVVNCCRQPWAAAMGCGAVCCAARKRNDDCQTILCRCTKVEATQDERSATRRVAAPGCEQGETAVVAASSHEHRVCCPGPVRS